MAAAESQIAVTIVELGEAVTEATITRWLKSVGDAVVDGEPLLEVATDKVDTENPAPATGILTEILEPADTVVAVGMTIADEIVALDRVLAAADWASGWWTLRIPSTA